MKKLKTFHFVLFGFLAIAFLLTVFEVITNRHVITSLYLINGICLILVYYIRKKEKSSQENNF